MEWWLTPKALCDLTICQLVMPHLASLSPHYHIRMPWHPLCAFAGYSFYQKCPLLSASPIEIFLPVQNAFHLFDCPLFLGAFLSYYTVQWIYCFFLFFRLYVIVFLSPLLSKTSWKMHWGSFGGNATMDISWLTVKKDHKYVVNEKGPTCVSVSFINDICNAVFIRLYVRVIKERGLRNVML